MGQKIKTVYRERKVDARWKAQLLEDGMSGVMARILAARGVSSKAQMDDSVAGLLMPKSMKGCAEAGQLLADAVQAGEKVVIVADYDCDGATACSVMIRGLRMLGAKRGNVQYVVPDRAIHGYGLTPPIVDLAMEHAPTLLVTVDNGIASFEGVDYAKSKGLKVLVTDHHLTAVVDGQVRLPAADVIVNPSQPNCEFGSKNLCGAGVAFYVILSARATLRERGWFLGKTEPQASELLDLVALATIADVVKLDENNRRLVALGLKRIRAGKAAAGLRALLTVSGVEPAKVNSTDLGFRLGPRVNAAGRLADMRVGIECLTADDTERATELAKQLHEINTQRKAVESDMTEAAQAVLEALSDSDVDSSIVVYDESFHEGVIGIVAGRIKEEWHRPTFVFAKSHAGTAKGSGRSIPGVHLRDVLDVVSKKHPGLLMKFGGHAMAAGATVSSERVEEFAQAFEVVCADLLSQEVRQRVISHDGSLGKGEYTIATADELGAGVWGQGFEPPLFVDKAEVLSQRIVGERHLKLSLRMNGENRDAIWFNRTEPVKDGAVLAYTIGANEWNGRRSVQMLVQGEYLL